MGKNKELYFSLKYPNTRAGKKVRALNKFTGPNIKWANENKKAIVIFKKDIGPKRKPFIFSSKKSQMIPLNNTSSQIALIIINSQK